MTKEILTIEQNHTTKPREKYETKMTQGWDSHKQPYEVEVCHVSISDLWSVYKKATGVHYDWENEHIEKDNINWLCSSNLCGKPDQDGYIIICIDRAVTNENLNEFGYKIVGKVPLSPFFVGENITILTDGLQLVAAPFVKT